MASNPLAKFLGLDKLANFRRIIKHNGGFLGSLSNLYRMDYLKDGTLVGVDQFGNKYYENTRYFMPRNRWVDYSKSVWLDYDGSQVPPEWHRWLHHITDDPPTTHPPEKREWFMQHMENQSHSERRYTPFSTTRPKIEAWVPPKQATS